MKTLTLLSDTLKSETFYIKNMSQTSTDNFELSNKWAETAEHLIDRFVAKNISMAYEFQQLTIDIPKAEAPGGRHIGSVRWTLNGRVRITAETYDKNGKGKEITHI